MNQPCLVQSLDAVAPRQCAGHVASACLSLQGCSGEKLHDCDLQWELQDSLHRVLIFIAFFCLAAHAGNLCQTGCLSIFGQEFSSAGVRVLFKTWPPKVVGSLLLGGMYKNRQRQVNQAKFLFRGTGRLACMSCLQQATEHFN